MAMQFSSYAGVKFAPTDQEIITHYLANFLKGTPARYGGLFKKLNIYAMEPWNLPKGFDYAVGSETYYLTTRIRRFNGKGKRVARRAGAGTWKMTGSERHVTVKDQVTGKRRVVGHVTQLCYIRDGEKVSSNWVMEEYTLANHKPHDDQEFEERAICKIKLNAVTERRNKKDQKASNS